MFRRMIGFVFVLIVMASVIGWFVGNYVFTFRRPFGLVILAGLMLAVLAFVFAARTMFRRNFAPVGALIEATQRLGEGDHGVRLGFPGPGPFVPVFRSFDKMAERLEEEDVRRRRFLADVGHELRTPMTVIRGEVEAVLDGLHPPGDVARVVDEIEVIDRLLDDLRLLSMAEAGTLKLLTEPTDLGELVGTTVASFSHITTNQNVDVVVDVSSGVPEVEVDPHRIHQILSNLVANALRQMPSGGELAIGVSSEPAAVIIEVADTGPGIAADEIKRIFDRFVRSVDSTGTGLGLSISRDLVEAHGGSLTARNRELGGAVFTIVLPRR